MATASILPEEQLIELLTQLQKTTPDQARAILNSQPQITYALMPLMIKMNLINLDVLQSTLASYTATGATQITSQNPVAPAVQAPVPAIPTSAHLVQAPNNTPTPPLQTQPSQPSRYPQNGSGYPQYSQPAPSVPMTNNASTAPALPPAFATLPEDQKALIMRVITMTPEQINSLPPAERANIVQVRATLGLPV